MIKLCLAIKASKLKATSFFFSSVQIFFALEKMTDILVSSSLVVGAGRTITVADHFSFFKDI
jgi:hypothetical protein